MSTEPIDEMRRNLKLALGRGGAVVGSAALDIAAKLAVCVLAEDVRAIREELNDEGPAR